MKTGMRKEIWSSGSEY